MNPNAYISQGCPYEHTFIVFMRQDIKRPCILPKDHPGNHVVNDPKENKPLEVWQK